MLAVSMISLAVLVGVAGYFWNVRRSTGSRTYTCRCAGCGQKVRYPAHRAGRPGACPCCKQTWVLPDRPTEVLGEVSYGHGYRVCRLDRPPLRTSHPRTSAGTPTR